MKHKSFFKIVLGLVLLSGYSLLGLVYAGPLDLDKSFATNGMTPILGTNTPQVYNQGLEILADGKILTVNSLNSNKGVFMRRNDDGSQDISFPNGIIANMNDDMPFDMMVQPDGKIVIVGYGNVGLSTNALLVARYHADGTVDSGFGNNGLTLIPNQTDFGGGVLSVALQSSGGIIVAGGIGDIVVARITSNGLPDLSFGNIFTFKAITDFAGRYELGWDVVVDMQNRIVVTGSSWAVPQGGGANDIRGVVIRYLPDGQLDTSFKDVQIGNNLYLCDFLSNCGKRNFSLGGGNYDYPTNVILNQSTGKIVISGQFGIARLNQNGTHDATFNNNGINTVVKGGGHDVAIRDDGRIIRLGNSSMALYNTNGQLDHDCVTNPIADIKFKDYAVDHVAHLQIDTNNKIVVVGTGHNPEPGSNSHSIFLARYQGGDCTGNLFFKDDTYYAINKFVHPQDKVGPIWEGQVDPSTAPVRGMDMQPQSIPQKQAMAR